jgi:hypothetical protein
MLIGLRTSFADFFYAQKGFQISDFKFQYHSLKFGIWDLKFGIINLITHSFRRACAAFGKDFMTKS